MKKLRYILKDRKSDELLVHFEPKSGEHRAEHTAHFKPEAELPNEYADRLMANPKFTGWFEVAGESAEFVCDKCGKICSTNWALGSHKRVHKQRGKNEETVDVPAAADNGG